MISRCGPESLEKPAPKLEASTGVEKELSAALGELVKPKPEAPVKEGAALIIGVEAVLKEGNSDKALGIKEVEPIPAEIGPTLLETGKLKLSALVLAPKTLANDPAGTATLLLLEANKVLLRLLTAAEAKLSKLATL